MRRARSWTPTPEAVAAATLHRRIQAASKPHLAYFVIVSFLLFQLSTLGWLPSALSRVAIVLGVLWLTRQILWVFRRWHDELPRVPLFCVCFAVLVLELLVENHLVWVASALDERKLDRQPALQDNVLRLFTAMSEGRPWLHAMLVYPLGDALKIISWALALAFSAAWDQMPYSGFGVMTRYCMTIAVSRVVRVACFLSTVVPSPRPGCYQRRFPYPVPDTWWGYFRVGFGDVRGFGGCNDLIFSGHGALWILTPLLFRAYYRPPGRLGTCMQWLMWIVLIQTNIRDVMDEQHYSVDMIVAAVVTWAVWDWLEWLYPPAGRFLSPSLTAESKRTPLPKPVALLILGCMLFVGIVIIYGKS